MLVKIAVWKQVGICLCLEACASRDQVCNKFVLKKINVCGMDKQCHTAQVNCYPHLLHNGFFFTQIDCHDCFSCHCCPQLIVVFFFLLTCTMFSPFSVTCLHGTTFWKFLFTVLFLIMPMPWCHSLEVFFLLFLFYHTNAMMPLFRNWKSRWPVGTKIKVGMLSCTWDANKHCIPGKNNQTVQKEVCASGYNIGA